MRENVLVYGPPPCTERPLGQTIYPYSRFLVHWRTMRRGGQAPWRVETSSYIHLSSYLLLIFRAKFMVISSLAEGGCYCLCTTIDRDRGMIHEWSSNICPRCFLPIDPHSFCLPLWGVNNGLTAIITSPSDSISGAGQTAPRPGKEQ